MPESTRWLGGHGAHDLLVRMAVARFPGLGHAEEHVVGVEHGEHEAAPAVEEAARAGRTWTGTARAGGARGRRARRVRRRLTISCGGQRRVAVRARDEVLEAAVRVVEQRLDERLDAALDHAPIRAPRCPQSARRPGGRAGAGSPGRARRGAPRRPRRRSSGGWSSRRPGRSRARWRRSASRSSGVTRSSASSDSTHSPVACSRAKFFCAAKPAHGRTQILSVNSRATCTVLSVDSASMTMISSAQATLSRQARSRSSSFHAMMVTLTPTHAVALEHGSRGLEDFRDLESVHGAVRTLQSPAARPVGAVALGAGRSVETESTASRGPPPGGAAPCHWRSSAGSASRGPSARRGPSAERGARCAPAAPGRSREPCALRRGPRAAGAARPLRWRAARPRRVKRATGHRFCGWPAPGLIATSRSPGLTPSLTRSSSIRRSAAAGTGTWNSAGPGSMPSGARSARYCSTTWRAESRGRHATVGEERVPALAAPARAEADPHGRPGVGGQEPALEQSLEIDGHVEGRRGGSARGAARPCPAPGGLPPGAR